MRVFSGRFVTRPLVFSVVCVAVVSMVSNSLVHQTAEKALHHEIRQNLTRIAQMVSLHVDGDRHPKWKPQDALTTDYQKAISFFHRLQEMSTDIEYAYTCVLRGGKVYFVLGTPDIDPKTGEPDYSYPNEPYEDATPEMLRALREGVATADQDFCTDKWGTFLSGYAPIRDSWGNLVGIVGVDMHLREYHKHLAALRQSAYTVYLLIITISGMIGVVIHALS